ncbi:MAG: hypothetical protein IPM59_09320 [Chloracidobacterium sp.]|nr:hypothetical protein [Chloracidobacterium sp.]
MSKDMIKISMLAIAGGIFTVLVCKVHAYFLVTPIMGILVGQAAHTLGAHKKTVNRLIVMIILIFLVVLPYVESHPETLDKMKAGFDRGFNQMMKAIERIQQTSAAKTADAASGRARNK